MNTQHTAPKTFIKIGGVLLVLFVIERIAKYIALQYIPDGGIFAYGQSLGFIVERNQGVAFSLPLPQALLLIVVLCIIIILTGIAFRAVKNNEPIVFAASSGMIIGAVSNALDRLAYGYVIDFIRLTRWPTFNLADVFIICGVSILILYSFTHSTYARPTHDGIDRRN